MAKLDKGGGCSVHSGIFNPANEEWPPGGQMGWLGEEALALSLCPYLSVHCPLGTERLMVGPRSNILLLHGSSGAGPQHQSCASRSKDLNFSKIPAQP